MIRGKVYKLGDNIDTDVIIPARYLNIRDLNELSKYCFCDLDKDFSKKIKKGDIIVAGNNFGCGSSREQAPLVIKESGVSCVIAKSFARIFYRNSINIGLPIIESEEIPDDVEEGDILQIDFEKGIVKNKRTNKKYKIKQFPEFIQNILSSGGLMNYLKSQLSRI
jgi:3-isopropylmalate/(R)-2-methylmalate dehydratase small subunit